MFSFGVFHHQISLCQDCLTRCSVPPRTRESRRLISPAGIWSFAKDVCLNMSTAHWPKAQVSEPNSSSIKRDTWFRHKQAVLKWTEHLLAHLRKCRCAEKCSLRTGAGAQNWNRQQALRKVRSSSVVNQENPWYFGCSLTIFWQKKNIRGKK